MVFLTATDMCFVQEIKLNKKRTAGGKITQITITQGLLVQFRLSFLCVLGCLEKYLKIEIA